MTKLSLHKETLRALDAQDVAGGVPVMTVPYTLYTCKITCGAPCTGPTPLTKVGCEPSGIVSCFPSAYRTNCTEPM